MKTLFAVLEEYWYVWVFAALGLWVVSLHGEIKDHKLQIAVLDRQIAQDEADRQRVAREHEQLLSERERTHATEQQEKEDAYNLDTIALRQQLDSERANSRGLRSKLAKATARSGQGSASDPAACGRTGDRLEALGGLAGEGVELLAEGRGLLLQCERDRRSLWDQINIDRKAMGQ